MNCVECDYSLEGLERDGVCPECGLAISKSLRPPLRISAAKEIRYIQTAIITFLCAMIVAMEVGPDLYWFYGPTQYQPMVHRLWHIAMYIGALAVTGNFFVRARGPRPIIIIILMVLFIIR